MPFDALDPVGSYLDLLTQAPPEGFGLPMADIDPSRRLSVQVARKVVGASIWDSYNSGPGWDDAVWDDPELLQWVDISPLVRGLEWTAGRDDPQAQPEAGTATIVLANLDGVASPWSQSGDLSEPVDGSEVVSLLRAGNHVRFGVLDSADWSPIFAGKIEAGVEDTVENVDGYVTVTAVDLLGVLSSYGTSLGHRAIPDGASGTDIALAVLADISWPYDFANAAPHAGDFALIAPDPNTNRLQALQLVAASCDGYLAASTSSLLFLDEGTSNDVGLTVANDPDPETEGPYVDATPYASTDRLLNIVVGTAAIEGAEPQKAKDPLSIYRHGPAANALGWPRTDLLQVHDADVKTLVTAVVARQANDFIGFSSVDLDADQQPESLYAALTFLAANGIPGQLQLTVRKVHPSGITYNAVSKIVGLTSTITALGPSAETAAKWEMTLQLATLSATVDEGGSS